jgi:hypothetical protein
LEHFQGIFDQNLDILGDIFPFVFATLVILRICMYFGGVDDVALLGCDYDLAFPTLDLMYCVAFADS